MEKETSSQSIIQPTKPQILRLSHQLLPKPTSAQKLNPTQPGDAESTETDRITPHNLKVSQPLGVYHYKARNKLVWGPQITA